MGRARQKNIPQQAVRRYPLYLREVRHAIAHGKTHVSVAAIAKKLNINPILARKDLAEAGIAGHPRRGFPALELRNVILKSIGWESLNEAVLCGAGSLGKALLGYSGFSEHNLSIVLAFDNSPSLVGRRSHGVPIHDVSEMEAMVAKLNVPIGILTTPASAAQECAEALVRAGVKGIWNFTPVKLHLPDGIVIQQVDLATSLALLSHEIIRRYG